MKIFTVLKLFLLIYKKKVLNVFINSPVLLLRDRNQRDHRDMFFPRDGNKRVHGKLQLKLINPW